MNPRVLLNIAVLPLAALLTGCGGAQDFGGFSRSLGGDIGTSYNTSLNSRYNGNNSQPAVGRGTYPMIETSFELASVPGDPFDYEKVNVQVTLRKPDGGTADVPAFFDGGTTWRMRYTPAASGQYAVVGVKLNRETTHEEKLEKKEWTVNGDPQPGFVRIDRSDHSRFVFDNGSRYYPLGHNQAWQSDGLPNIPTLFGKMHAAGENWSRVWMAAWDGLNLDWSEGGKSVKPGGIDLEAAKRWDAIVQAAEKNDIYFQMTLQHHGQYASKSGYKNSSNVDPNWESNPYSEKNGGFLRSPDEFFTNPQARALTKRKLYYILARWGYSPNIMAFELFNEVENTDAAKGRLFDDIAMWHKEMTLFLRQFDNYRHLVTTSAALGMPLDNPVWQPVDYIQTHLYPPDIVTALSNPALLDAKKLDKPDFIGEFGPSGLNDADGVQLHNGLWTSLMRSAAGAAQYWSWDEVEKHDLYSHFKAANGFLTASGLANQSGLASVTPTVESSQKGDLRFGPGGGWGNATQNEFVVGTTGTPAGIGAFPAYLQGQAHREMMPKPLTFQVSYTQPGTFSVTVGQIAKSGANLKVSMDGKAAEREYAAGSSDYMPKAEQETLTVDVPAGAHTLTVENTGKDWVVVRRFSFSNYAPALGALGRVGKEFAAAWVYHRGSLDAPADRELTPATGRLSLAGLQKGRYRATWWDTRAGKMLDSTDLAVADAKTSVVLNTPPVTRDAALYVVKAGTPTPGSLKGRKTSVAREDLKKTLSPPSSTPPAPSTPSVDTAPPPGPQ
jgi:hypothetical protein